MATKEWQATCLLHAANLIKTDDAYNVDRSGFDKTKMLNDMPMVAPKLHTLMEKIKELDESDMRTHGQKFKHFIFTNQDRDYGLRLVVGAFMSYGYPLAFEKRFTSIHSHVADSFGVLTGRKLFYDNNVPSRHFIKNMMTAYNERQSDGSPVNNIRFIVLDNGFKEGIDLFDVKYVHLLEPLHIRADEQQSIGRATRYCGQKGLAFDPTFGWKLRVFVYDMNVEDHNGVIVPVSRLAHMHNHVTTDDKTVTQSDMQDIVSNTAIDRILTKHLHNFDIDRNIDNVVLDGGDDHAEEEEEEEDTGIVFADDKFEDDTNDYVEEDYVARPAKRQAQIALSQHFKRFVYERPEMINMCSADIQKTFELTMTQRFLREYFTPSLPRNGMLLWSSVGTGKTCAAIAVASHTFERLGYTILWVTRHTLKADIWKNMFTDKSCHTTLSRFPNPAGLNDPLRHMPKNWIEPISYKQFTNLLERKNKYYDMLKERNGAADPLRRTLIIIDEVHKLYDKGALPAQERPNMKTFETMLTQSYTKSGINRARVLLMSATPFMNDPMNFVKTVNLIVDPAYKMPTVYSKFKEIFLDATGRFTDEGYADFVNRINGTVAYIDRTKDARYFASVNIEKITVDAPGLEKDFKLWSALKDAVEVFVNIKEKERRENVGMKITKFVRENFDALDTKEILAALDKNDVEFVIKRVSAIERASEENTMFTKNLMKKCYTKSKR